MMIKLVSLWLLFQLSMAGTQKSLECKSARSKICWLQLEPSVGSEVPKFPDLTEKHTLIIRSGNIARFTDDFTSQLGGVTKVTLGRLNIEALHIPPNWVSLNAESNKIRELIVNPIDEDSSMMNDGPDSGDIPSDGDEPDIEPKGGDQPKLEQEADGKPGRSNETKAENAKDGDEVDHDDRLGHDKPDHDGETKHDNGTEVDNGSKKIPDPDIANTTTVEATGAEEFHTESTILEETTTITTTTTTIKPVEVMAPLKGYQLQSLNLVNNKLKSIRNIKVMINLKELLLDGNELEFIEMATFDKMKKLRKLSLSRNKINHISCPEQVQLPSLEWFSLASNQLKTLQINNWIMLQLVELHLSHNELSKLDSIDFEQFVSLEKLAVANNSWTCFWLNGALKEIGKRDFITLLDRDDNPDNCPNGLPVEGVCCSMTVHNDDESMNENLHDRIQRFQNKQDGLKNDFKRKIYFFGNEWHDQWKVLSDNVAEKRKQYDLREKQPKDDSKVTEKDMQELMKLIADCKSVLKNMENHRKEASHTAQSFTQSFYTVIDLKNKLLAAMRSSSKLKNDLHQYEISFKADVK